MDVRRKPYPYLTALIQVFAAEHVMFPVQITGEALTLDLIERRGQPTHRPFVMPRWGF